MIVTDDVRVTTYPIKWEEEEAKGKDTGTCNLNNIFLLKYTHF